MGNKINEWMELDLLCEINQRISLFSRHALGYISYKHTCVCMYVCVCVCVCVYQTSIYDFSGGSMVNNLPTRTGDWVHTLGQEDPP